MLITGFFCTALSIEIDNGRQVDLGFDFLLDICLKLQKREIFHSSCDYVKINFPLMNYFPVIFKDTAIL